MITHQAVVKDRASKTIILRSNGKYLGEWRVKVEYTSISVRSQHWIVPIESILINHAENGATCGQ